MVLFQKGKLVWGSQVPLGVRKISYSGNSISGAARIGRVEKDGEKGKLSR
jgi:hypothetical protein